DDFTKTAQRNGYKNKFLEKSGLSIIKPNQAFDRFRHRVIFPIHNLSGKVVGFGARLLTNDKKKPKYLNSPESEIYNKSKILYGIYFAKGEMVKEDQCLLTEGYTDVIALHQSGITNAVASSGTSLTEDQIRLIKRYTQNITILYDGDAAGLKASFRGIDMILQQGMNVKVVLFPEGEDPDSYASAHSTTETRQYIEEKAEDFIRFKSRILFHENQDDPTARANAIEEIAYSISLIPNLLIRDQYIKATWESLGIEQEKLSFRIEKLRADRRKKEARKQEETLPDKTPRIPSESNRFFEQTYPSEDDLIRVMILYGRYLMEYESEKEPLSISAAEFIVNELKHIDFAFRNKSNQQIFDAFCEELEQDTIPDTSFFLNLPDPKLSQHVIHLISEKFNLSENWEKQMGIFTAHESDNIRLTVESLIWDNKARQIEIRLNELNKEIKNASEEAIMPLLEEHKELKTQHAQINQKRGRIITK
ncbi:MAG: DNA primase, partial [Bacteroidota bacterium]